MFQGINIIEFSKRFTDNNSCYQYLMEFKWGKGYHCSRCSHTAYTKGRTAFYLRCKKCRYDESVTANTVFHGMKMPVLKAFHIIFRLTAKKKGMSTVELGAEVKVQQKTAWLFKRKLQSVMKDKAQLQGNVDVDETIVGGYSPGTENRGRSLKDKTAVVIAIEKLGGDKTGNINLNVIDNFRADSLEAALTEMIAPDTHIQTDKHRSYEALTAKLPITTIASEKGGAFPEIHKQIMLFKNWLRGIHHKCSKTHLHAYLDEYKYRFNKRNMRKWIFNDLAARLMNNKPRPYSVLAGLCDYST
jgi:transposase-like protein